MKVLSGEIRSSIFLCTGKNYLSPYLREIVTDVSEHPLKQLCNGEDINK